jgi:hypothetical protein
MNSSAVEGGNFARDGGVIADMDQRVATILFDGEIRGRSRRLALPDNLALAFPRRHDARIEVQFLARSGT